MEQNKLIPIAIVLAGVLIAGAVFFVNRDSSTSGGKNTAGTTVDNTLTEVRAAEEADHLRGNPEAPVTIIEYSDFECPFCQRFHDSLKEVMDTSGREGSVAWVYRHFPLAQLHSKAPAVSQASECVAELGGNDAFWRFTDTYYETTPSNNQIDLTTLPSLAEQSGVDRAQFEECISGDRNRDKVEEDFAEAVAAGGTGTPFSVFVFDGEIDSEMQQLFGELNRQLGDELFVQISDTQVGMSGALSAEVINLVINTYLGEN